MHGKSRTGRLIAGELLQILFLLLLQLSLLSFYFCERLITLVNTILEHERFIVFLT